MKLTASKFPDVKASPTRAKEPESEKTAGYFQTGAGARLPPGGAFLTFDISNRLQAPGLLPEAAFTGNRYYRKPWAFI